MSIDKDHLITEIRDLKINSIESLSYLEEIKRLYVDGMGGWDIQNNILHMVIFEKFDEFYSDDESYNKVFPIITITDSFKSLSSFFSKKKENISINRWEYRVLYFKASNNYKICKVYFDKEPLFWAEVEKEFTNFDEIINIAEAKNKSILYGDFDFPKEYIPK